MKHSTLHVPSRSRRPRPAAPPPGWFALAAAAVVATACLGPAATHAAPAIESFFHKTTIGPGYGLNVINGTSFARNNVVTVGDQQFVAYYEPLTAANDGYDGHVIVARRTIGSDTWHRSETSFLSNNITDTHDIISIAVDGDGILHMSWGMHANQGGDFNYARSTASVLAPASAITFTADLGPAGMTGNETQVTYPEFLKMPDGDLLFFYRNGTSGDGDLRLNRYDTATDQWSVVRQPLIDGTVPGDASSSNAYWNTPTLDDAGNLHLTWLFRWNKNNVNSFDGIQTNHNLYYAVSPDEGTTWKKNDGSTYAMPITQSTSDRVVQIDQGSSYINQSSMTVDANNLPIVATRWAPDAASGNNQPQQMLAWSDGDQWHVSQITNFASGSNAGRRPSVLVDEDNRVLVLISGSSLGPLVLAYSTDPDRVIWQFIALDAGPYNLDPTYDLVRWQRDGVISMLYQRAGVGNEVETVSLFEFDARAYFDALIIPEPATLIWVGPGALWIVRRSRRGRPARPPTP